MSESDDPFEPQADDPDPEPRLEVSVAGCSDALAGVLHRAAVVSLRAHGIQTGQLEVAVVDDAEMSAQHARWMDDDSPTDALTFDLRDEPDDSVVDGQLIVCESVARRRAAAAGHKWEDELTLYVVHGCLHLCGFDDRTSDDSSRMHVEEDRILVEMGLPPVFKTGEARDKEVS